MALWYRLENHNYQGASNAYQPQYDSLRHDPLVQHKVTAIVKDSNGSIAMLELDHSYIIPVTHVLTW